MKTNTLNEIAESYINGNISDTKDKIKRMSKKDLINFVMILTECFPKPDLQDSLLRVKKLLD